MSYLWVTYGAMMYMLGLFSCALLVILLLKVTKPIHIDRGDARRLQQEFQNYSEKQRLRIETKLCIQRYCPT